MTNPNNAIGTNGAYSGRTSVDAFNDILGAFNGRGIISGWSVSPSSGMTITLGGVTGIRDVAIAVATGGSRTTINNRSGSPVSLTIDTAPATNSRIDAIVAYVSNPPQGTTELADNPSACGLIAVKGTVASSPTAPTESMIRSAITSDGAVGSTAYYVVLGAVKVVAGVTTITSNYITQGTKATIGTNNIANSAVTTAKLANSAVTTAKLANSAVTSDKIDFTTLKYLSGMPVAKINRSIGYSLTACLCRIGNIVILSTDSVVGSTLPTGLNGSALAETIPSGYRPIVPVAFEGQRQDGAAMEAKWRVQTDGSMTVFTYGAYGTVRWGFNAVWITNDAWPS